mgnify:CR=1 FL=1
MAKRGLYANIHAKRKRIKAGSKEKMRKPGSKGAPTAANFKRAAKTAKKKWRKIPHLLKTCLMLNGIKSHLLKDQIHKELKHLFNSQKDLKLSLLFQSQKFNLIFLSFLVSQVVLGVCLLMYLL